MKKTIKILSDILLELNNFDIQKYESTFVMKTLEKRMQEKLDLSESEYFAIFEINIDERLKFIDSLLVHYSEFFRNPLTFSVLEKIVFPQLICEKLKRNQHEIRIWSMACAAGQEAYSMAIILKELLANSPINFRIFATDISPDIIQTAETGSFHSSDLNFLNLNRLNSWFKAQKDSYIISNEIKKHIEFSVFDCLDDKNAYPAKSLFGDFDLVFCANILFYYQSTYKNRIIDNARNCLSKDGLLITSETEREIINNLDFTEIYPNSAIFKVNKKK